MEINLKNLKKNLSFSLDCIMDVFNSIAQFAQEQIDCIECRKQQKILNEDIVKLKNFVARYKPNPYQYPKSLEGSRRYQEDFKEWDNLMRL